MRRHQGRRDGKDLADQQFAFDTVSSGPPARAGVLRNKTIENLLRETVVRLPVDSRQAPPLPGNRRCWQSRISSISWYCGAFSATTPISPSLHKRLPAVRRIQGIQDEAVHMLSKVAAIGTMGCEGLRNGDFRQKTQFPRSKKS